jgi:transposase
MARSTGRASWPISSSSWYRRSRPATSSSWTTLGSHKGHAVRRAIRAVGAKLLFLPPYSPDLNPIEQVFAKLKTLLRKANERSVETVWRRIGTLLEEFPPDECANYLSNSGYASFESDQALSVSIRNG